MKNRIIQNKTFYKRCTKLLKNIYSILQKYSKINLNPKEGKIIESIGYLMILGFGISITIWIYKNHIQHNVFTNNYTTSVLFSESLKSTSGAAPWAIISLNWYLCKSGIMKWAKWIRQKVENPFGVLTDLNREIHQSENTTTVKIKKIFTENLLPWL